MIVTTDIANILYRDCKAFGMKIHQKGSIPDGEVNTERIIIYPKDQVPGKIWKKGFVEVNLCVPNESKHVANLIRLGELERQANALFDVVDSYNGTHYRYSIESIGIEADTALECHYVNCKLLFETLNC